MTEIPTSAAEGTAERRWLWRLAVAFVVLTLIALVTVPWAVQRRVSGLRADIVASEPARTLVMEWQFSLAREMASLSALLLSGDTAQASTFQMALAREEATSRELAALAADMGPDVLEPFAAARTLAVEWHRRVNDAELMARADAGIVLLESERPLFQEVLRTVAAVDSTIVRATARRRANIQAAERTGLAVTLLLGVLALFAAGTVVALDARLRRFALETERRREEADRALAKSAEANEARARLLRGITHDVKNPLGAAKGYADLLAMGVKAPVAPEQTPLVEGIKRSVDSALAIIADLLDFARVESGGMTLNRVEVDLAEVVREAVEDYRAAAESAGHVLKAAAGNGPVAVYTDPVRVRQVLDNLISNAIKYVPAPGRIEVRVAPVADTKAAPGPGAWATAEVSDTGPGIPPDLRDAVFDEFTRLDEDSAMAGHGLGLAIARGVARRLGGDLTIADTSTGATFVLWLPRRG